MTRLNAYVWRIMQCLPIVFILWHVYTAITYGPGNLYLTLWIIEGVWIVLYICTLPILVKPTPSGYWYLITFISLNLAWELWISYLILDQQRLFTYSALIGFLMILYYYRHRFKVNEFQSIVSVCILIILILEAGFFGLKIDDHYSGPEVLNWSSKSTGQMAPANTNFYWSGTRGLVTHIIQPETEPVATKQNKVAMVRFDLDSNLLSEIDNNSNSPICSADGQWIAYQKRKEWEGKQEVNQYIRFFVPSGEREVLLQGSFRGNVFAQMMAPTGDKLIVTEYPDEQMQIFPMKEPNWQVFEWHRTNRDTSKGIWLPDGSATAVYKENTVSIYSVDGHLIRNLPLVPMNYDGHISLIGISPDGDYLYVGTTENSGRDGGVYYLRLSESLSGWQSTELRLVRNFTVGPKGILVYNYLPSGLGAYTYLAGERLANRGLWIYDPATKENIRITTDYDQRPSISTDGQTIAFLRANPEKNKIAIGEMEVMLLTKN